MDTPDRARRYLAKLPVAVSGQGGHNATFRAACALVHGFGLAEADALAVLGEWNRSCQPPWSESELRHKVMSAVSANSRRSKGYLLRGKTGAIVGSAAPNQKKAQESSEPAPALARPAKAVFVPAILKRVASLMPNVDEEFIKERSPLRPDTQTPASFLQRLYRPGEWVIVFDVFESQGRHVCQCVEPPYDAGCLDHLANGCPDGVWFLCNPVDGKFHPNPRHGGKRSRRSEESVTDWRYLLLESDKAAAQPWLAALVQMPLRIAAIYTSGGRSIHALVRVDAASKSDWDSKARELKPLMTILGGDRSAMSAVQLTRLPGCHRGQVGPRGPKMPRDPNRWKSEPLEYDAAGDPIWTPKVEPAPTANMWTGGRLQELLYLNPTPELEPIFRKPTRQEKHEEWLKNFSK